MKTLLAALFLVLVPSVASANCWGADDSATDATPAVRLCYEGKCEETTVASYCRAPGTSGISFANGWSKSYDVENEWTAALNDTPRDPSKMSCENIGGPYDDVISPECWFIN